MPRIRRSKRRSSSLPLAASNQLLATFKRNLNQALHNARRRQRLRKQRRLERRLNTHASQELRALRAALEFRWLRRRLQRRQRAQPPAWNLTSWLWPLQVEPISTREAAALVLRRAATLLLLLVLIMLVINAIPLQLFSPNWYLQVLAYLAENIPVLIVAAMMSLLSLALNSNELTSSPYRSRLVRLSRLGYILALLLLPLQLGFTAWLFGQTYNIDRAQRTAIRANSDALISGARQTATTEQFVAYLRSRNITANLQSIAAAPLAQVRTEFIRTVQTNQQERERNLSAAIRETLLRHTTNSIKLFANLLLLAAFLRTFQVLARRCSLQRPAGAAGPALDPAPDDQP